MKEVVKYGTRYLYPEKLSDLIGRLIWSYDPGRCDKITPNGRWASDEGYDDDCEEHYVITGIIQGEHEYFLCGIHLRSYDDALIYSDVKDWQNAGHPIVAIRQKELPNLYEHLWCKGVEMEPIYEIVKNEDGLVTGTPVIGFRKSGKVLRWDLFHGSAEDFVRLYEED